MDIAQKSYAMRLEIGRAGSEEHFEQKQTKHQVQGVWSQAKKDKQFRCNWTRNRCRNGQKNLDKE